MSQMMPFYLQDEPIHAFPAFSESSYFLPAAFSTIVGIDCFGRRKIFQS